MGLFTYQVDMCISNEHKEKPALCLSSSCSSENSWPNITISSTISAQSLAMKPLHRQQKARPAGIEPAANCLEETYLHELACRAILRVSLCRQAKYSCCFFKYRIIRKPLYRRKHEIRLRKTEQISSKFC